MFEEAADDGAHLDALGNAADAGPQTAHTTDDQLNVDARPRSSVQRLYDRRFRERIELGDDAGRFSGARVLGLAFDLREQRLVQAEGRVQQLAQFRHLREPGELQEYFVDVLANGFIGSQQTVIGVEAR